MSRDTKTVIIVVVLAAVALIVFGLRPATTKVEVFPPVTLGDPQPDGLSAVVTGKRQSGGLSILGLRLGQPTYSIDVQFFAPPGCFHAVDFGDPWPAPSEECSSPVPVVGEITGKGRAPTGESVITVGLEVPKDCHELVAPGAVWPVDVAECSASPGG